LIENHPSGIKAERVVRGRESVAGSSPDAVLAQSEKNLN
jgi:hypothetical protein